MTVAFLIPGLFLPRLTLFICLVIGATPPNDIPLAIDLLCVALAPRALFAWWAYQDPGTHPLWAVLFAGLQIVEWVRAPQRINVRDRGDNRRGGSQNLKGSRHDRQSALGR